MNVESTESYGVIVGGGLASCMLFFKMVEIRMSVRHEFLMVLHSHDKFLRTPRARGRGGACVKVVSELMALTEYVP